ncbi:MAG: glycosyltransferase family 4 protein [Gemmatimonadota bacterium]
MSDSPEMRVPVLLVSNYFPPEVNALATRTYEHAREWVTGGGSVQVLTGVPHFPEGAVYEGYRNRFSREDVDGIDVYRVPMYVHANEGLLRRTLSYSSFMLSAIWQSRRIAKPAVVVASSPQFFAGLAGYVISRLKRVPFVLEVRDLWPESIVAVGAMRRNGMIKVLERIEQYLYHHADHIVVVAEPYRDHIESRGIEPNKITVLPNGVDSGLFGRPLEQERMAELRARLGLEGKFLVSYIGTVGMAHGASVLLEAARLCTDPDVVFAVVGTGAERKKLEADQALLSLPNFRLIEKQTRELVRYYYALTSVSVIHLRDLPLFRKVIPSKMFESMAMGKPIVLGVEGEARRILDQAQVGIAIKPDDVAGLLSAVQHLRDNPDVYRRMSANGPRFVREHYERKEIAREYWRLLERISARRCG